MKLHVMTKTGTLLILFFLFCSQLFGQNNLLSNEQIAEQLQLSGRRNQPKSLFLHLDKNIYTNNEPIWFSAYILDRDTLLNKDNVLTVALIGKVNHQIYATAKYKIEEDLSSGNLMIPDAIPSGEYQLHAHTNLMKETGEPAISFDQSVMIKNIAQPGLQSAVHVPEMPVAKAAVNEGITLHFYPEGGALIDGLTSTVGWESTARSGAPLSITAILKQNGQIIDTLSTNSYGMGSFMLSPQKGQSYSMTLLKAKGTGGQTDFPLPASLSSGLVLSIPAAVTEDTLRLNMAARQRCKVKVLIHDQQNTYAAIDMQVRPPYSRLAIALPSLGRGLYTVTVLNDQNEPLAERLFFAHYSKKSTTLIESNAPAYKNRETVKLKVSVKKHSGTIVPGVISVACVQGNRLSLQHSQDIESYYYLTRFLSALPADPGGRGIEQIDYLGKILLMKRGRKINWNQIMNRKNDTISSYHLVPALYTSVMYREKPVRKPVEMNIMSGEAIRLFSTDSLGNYTLTADELLTAHPQKVKLSVNTKYKDNYLIRTADPDSLLMQWVVDHMDKIAPADQNNFSRQEESEPQGMDNPINLLEVKINADKDHKIYGTKAWGSNFCGDYVDDDNYLNWPGSKYRFSNRAPVKGTRYIDGKMYTRPDGTTDAYENMRSNNDKTFTVAFIIYEGCTTDPQKLYTEANGIFMSSEFSPLTDEQLKSAEPKYLSTIFWKAGIHLDQNGEADFSFPAGDIKGPFKVVVQGVQSDDVIYADKVVTIN